MFLHKTTGIFTQNITLNYFDFLDFVVYPGGVCVKLPETCPGKLGENAQKHPNPEWARCSKFSEPGMLSCFSN